MGAKSEIPTPEGEAKMSAVILQVAEPLLKQHGETAERAEAIADWAVGTRWDFEEAVTKVRTSA